MSYDYDRPYESRSRHSHGGKTYSDYDPDDEYYDTYSTTSRHSRRSTGPSRSSHALVVRHSSHDDYDVPGATITTTRNIRRTREYLDHDDYPRGSRGDYQKQLLGKKNMILAAVLGAGLTAGAKEIYDRREARYDEDGEREGPKRNLLTSAALAAAGGLAAYQGSEMLTKKRDKKQMALAYGDEAYYHDQRGGSSGKFLQSALGATSLVAMAKKFGGSSGRDSGSQYGGSQYGGSRHPTSNKLGTMGRTQKAAMASLLAGATEAFRVAKEPGDWKGDKAKRVVTAAIGAGAIDRVRDPQKQKHKKLSLIESVVGGLVGNRVINGSKGRIYRDEYSGRSRSRPRNESRERRSRSSSRGGGGKLKKVAGLTAAAVGAKKLLGSGEEKGRRGRKSYDDDLAYGQDYSAPKYLEDRPYSPDSPRYRRSISRSRSRSRSRAPRARSRSVGRMLGKLGLSSRHGSPNRARSRSQSRTRGGPMQRGRSPSPEYIEGARRLSIESRGGPQGEWGYGGIYEGDRERERDRVPMMKGAAGTTAGQAGSVYDDGYRGRERSPERMNSESYGYH